MAEEITEQIQALVQRAGADVLVFENEHLADAVHRVCGVTTSVETPSLGGRVVRDSLTELAIANGLVDSADDLRDKLVDEAFDYLIIQTRTALGEADVLLNRAVLMLRELDGIINLLFNKVREWYGLHFPELSRIVRVQETFLKVLVNINIRREFSGELSDPFTSGSQLERIRMSAASSAGSDILEVDLRMIKRAASGILPLLELRRDLESYLEKSMMRIAPNLKELLGAKLGAQLIATAGGLEKLAMKPSSTIQILGAEKALQQSKRTGSKPPKHGMIFQYPELHGAPRKLRGRIARAVAGKTAIAARLDAFGGEFRGQELRRELAERIDEILREGC